MAERSSRKRWLVGGLLLVSAAAWASPWDIDMIDAVMFKAYEWEMKPQPADVVSRESMGAPLPREAGYYQNAAIATVSRTDKPTIDALSDPYASDANHTARGQRLFRINCAPCHGLEGKGDGPVTKNDVVADGEAHRRLPVLLHPQRRQRQPWRHFGTPCRRGRHRRRHAGLRRALDRR